LAVTGRVLPVANAAVRPSGLLDIFFEWQQVYEERTFNNNGAFVTSGPAVEVIQTPLSYQNCILSHLEL